MKGLKLSDDLLFFRCDRPSEYKMDEYYRKALSLENQVAHLAVQNEQLKEQLVQVARSSFLAGVEACDPYIDGYYGGMDFSKDADEHAKGIEVPT